MKICDDWASFVVTEPSRCLTGDWWWSGDLAPTTVNSFLPWYLQCGLSVVLYGVSVQNVGQGRESWTLGWYLLPMPSLCHLTWLTLLWVSSSVDMLTHPCKSDTLHQQAMYCTAEQGCHCRNILLLQRSQHFSLQVSGGFHLTVYISEANCEVPPEHKCLLWYSALLHVSSLYISVINL